jgi:hypothetical protein
MTDRKMKQVTLPPGYFYKLAIKDYHAWRKALVREFIQNSVDASSDLIEFIYDGWFFSRLVGEGLINF